MADMPDLHAPHLAGTLGELRSGIWNDDPELPANSEVFILAAGTGAMFEAVAQAMVQGVAGLADRMLDDPGDVDIPDTPEGA